MPSMDSYPKAAMERAMKVLPQAVLRGRDRNRGDHRENEQIIPATACDLRKAYSLELFLRANAFSG